MKIDIGLSDDSRARIADGLSRLWPTATRST